MRAARRLNLSLPTLTSDGVGATLARQHEVDRAADPTVKLSFPEHWNNPDVRGALYAAHGAACAYCGSALTRGDRGDVEHFRPKGKVSEDKAHGGYWWLAYALINYLVSCSKCNRHFKRERFPLRPAGVRITHATRADLDNEPRLLLNPSLDTVEDWLRVEWEKADAPCMISPSPGLPPQEHTQVKKTLDFFRINKDSGLVRERNEMRDEVLKLLESREFARVCVMAVRYRPHSLIAKQILAAHAPAHLPTPRQELLWLLGDFLKNLENITGLLKRWPGDARLEIDRKEVAWSLAALWRDPPAGTSAADVETFLDSKGIIDLVRKFYERL